MVTTITLSITIAVLLIYIAWKERTHNKLITELTTKLMCRDIPEYVRAQKDLTSKVEEPKKERRKVPVDPVLGSQF